MTFNNYIEVDYVNNDPDSAFYNPIPINGASLDDVCKDLSTGDWYIFDGSNWNLSYSELFQPISGALIDMVEVLDLDDSIFSSISAQTLDLRYSISDDVISTTIGASLIYDKSGIIRVVRK